MKVYVFDIMVTKDNKSEIIKAEYELTNKEMQSDKIVFEEAIAHQLKVDSVDVLLITEKHTNKLFNND